jgi:hypothetical protein
MKIIRTDFSKELSNLLLRHKKTIQVDKNGIFIVDDEIGTSVLIGKPETTSEDYRDKLLFVSGKQSLQT